MPAGRPSSPARPSSFRPASPWRSVSRRGSTPRPGRRGWTRSKRCATSEAPPPPMLDSRPRYGSANPREESTMRRTLRFGLALALAALPAAAQQQDFSKVEMKVVPVSGNIYMLQGSGGNIGVSAGSDGILIVDDQYAPLAEKIRAALKGINPGKLKFVLNTHFHGDQI